MTSSDDDDEKPTVIVDPYRIVVHASPADLGEQTPQSWRDVARQVNRHLMRIAAGPTRLLAELFESATRALRGIGRVPDAIANRVDNAHDYADRAESHAQRGLLPESLAGPSSEALALVKSVLSKYRVQGHYADVVLDPNGDPIIVIVRPEIVDAIAETTKTALPATEIDENEGPGA